MNLSQAAKSPPWSTRSRLIAWMAVRSGDSTTMMSADRRRGTEWFAAPPPIPEKTDAPAPARAGPETRVGREAPWPPQSANGEIVRKPGGRRRRRRVRVGERPAGLLLGPGRRGLAGGGRRRPGGLAAPDDRMVHATPRVAAPARTRESETALSLLSSMVRRTPWVSDWRDAGIVPAAANRAATARVDSTREGSRGGRRAGQPPRREHRRGDAHAAAIEPRPQELPAAREPPADRADRPGEQPGGLLVRLALEVAEHDRLAVLAREPASSSWSKGRTSSSNKPSGAGPVGLRDRLDIGRAVSRRGRPRPMGRPVGHAVEPGGQRVAHPDRTGLPHQDQERRLEGVVRVLGPSEDLAANPQHHRPVAFHQLAEGRLGRTLPAADEPAQELGVAQPGEGPGGPEHLELATDRIDLGWNHRCSAPLIDRSTGRMRRVAIGIQTFWKIPIFHRDAAGPAGARRIYGPSRRGYNRFMSTTIHPILIGTSGWSYPEWDGAFYPPGMDPADYLGWYPTASRSSRSTARSTASRRGGWSRAAQSHAVGFPVRAEGPPGHHPQEAARWLRQGRRGVRRGDRADGRQALVRVAPVGVFQPRAVPLAGCVPGDPGSVPGVVAARCGAPGAGDPQPEVGGPGTGRGACGGTTPR